VESERSPVVIHNKFMGGVDLINSVMTLYRTTVRSKKYYHRILFHLMDLMCVNVWFLYRRNVTEEDNMPFLDFEIGVVQVLLKANKSYKLTRLIAQKAHLWKQSSNRSVKEDLLLPYRRVMKDSMKLVTLQNSVKERGPNKKAGCKGIPKVKCMKYNIYLCFTPHLQIVSYNFTL